MMVLTRKPGEKIMIRLPGDEMITITLVETRRDGKARIGVEAPRALPVDREEIFLQKVQPAA